MFKELSASEAFGISGLGLLIVFGVLVFLIFFIWILKKVIHALSPSGAASAAPIAAPAPAAPKVATPAPLAAGMVEAPGSSGEVALHTVDDKTAALLMAIVADDLGVHPNTLRFTSIREV
jgi:Na+-transporting methylmalonyl-CoA/oxaloacetate decarboxylase gamma subunit